MVLNLSINTSGRRFIIGPFKKRTSHIDLQDHSADPYLRISFSLERTVQIWLLLFLFFMFLAGLLLGLRGGAAGRFDSPARWLLLRLSFLLLLIPASYELRRGRLRRSRFYLLLYLLVSLVYPTAVPYYDPGIHLLIILLSAVFALQAGWVMDMSIRGRIFYLLFINLYLLLILFLYRESMAGDSNSLVGAIYFIGAFIYFAVLVPNLIAELRNYRTRRILKDMAYLDDVTGLPAKYALVRDLEETLAESHKREKDLALIALSVRNLGYINGRYGHAAGDHILNEIARSMKNMEGFAAYRLTGAMFVLLAGEAWIPEQSRRLETLLNRRLPQRLRLEESYYTPEYDLLGTLSPFDGRNTEHLIRNLQNMGGSIKRGKGESLAIQWFNKKDFVKVERQYLLAGHLDQAFKDGEFYILIQPQIEIREGRVFGGEVLSRWKHPELGIISPVEFIPVLEREGRSFEFASYLVERCLSLNCSVKRGSIRNCNMSLNLSASTLNDPGVLKILERLQKKGRAFRPEIEITEDLFLMLDEDVSHKLKEIRSLGFGLSLDDFGTGFSNLSYLQELEVDSLKIDRRFIAPLPGDENSLSIVRAIISMAHSFGIKVIAEGVETEEQYGLLKDLGCDIIQGFYFARPMPPEEFLRFTESFDPGSLLT